MSSKQKKFKINMKKKKTNLFLKKINGYKLLDINKNSEDESFKEFLEKSKLKKKSNIRLFGNRFKLIKNMGGGSFGLVYLVKDIDKSEQW